VPAFVFFFFLLYPPREGKGAAGGCILLRTDTLKKIGGLDSIKGELIDDCALAGVVGQDGGRVWLGLSPQTMSIRDYPGFQDIGRMISRTAFSQLRYSAVVLLGTLMAMALVFAVPPALALTASQPARGMGALAWLLMSLAYVPALRYYRRSPLWAPFLPLVALFYSGCTVQSAIAHWRGAGGLWKGRTHQ
jgi:hopene-associated glycosyltransferase HpnB